VPVGVQSTQAGQGTLDLANQVATVTFQFSHSRGQESEADIMGLELMVRAGYDPQSAVHVWQKMLATNKSNPPQFLSTHPSAPNRIGQLQAAIPKVIPLCRAAHRDETDGLNRERTNEVTGGQNR
jgi:predicted Zn-dependent protease